MYILDDSLKNNICVFYVDALLGIIAIAVQNCAFFHCGFEYQFIGGLCYLFTRIFYDCFITVVIARMPQFQ